MKLFKTKSIKIKKSVTLGRLPNDSEIGKILKKLMLSVIVDKLNWKQK